MQYECAIQRYHSPFTHLQGYYHCVWRKTLPCTTDMIRYESSVIVLNEYCAAIDEMQVRELSMTWIIYGGPAIQIHFLIFDLRHSFPE